MRFQRSICVLSLPVMSQWLVEHIYSIIRRQGRASLNFHIKWHLEFSGGKILIPGNLCGWSALVEIRLHSEVFCSWMCPFTSLSILVAFQHSLLAWVDVSFLIRSYFLACPVVVLLCLCCKLVHARLDCKGRKEGRKEGRRQEEESRRAPSLVAE